MENNDVTDNQEKEKNEDQERFALIREKERLSAFGAEIALRAPGNNRNSLYYLAFAKGILTTLILVILLIFSLESLFLFNEIKPKLINSVSNLESISKDSQKGITNIVEITDKGKSASTILITDDRAKELANYLDVLNYNTQISQNDLKKAINESVKTSQEIRAGIKPILANANLMVAEGTNLIVEAKHQLKQNGDSANELLEQGKTLIAKSDKDLLETLKNINTSMAGISLITNDPNLQKLIENSSLTMGNIQVTTKEIADLSTFYLHPFSHPVKPKGFNKYLFQPVLKVFRIVNGASGVLYLVNRIQ